jgi:hypothetical protein
LPALSLSSISESGSKEADKAADGLAKSMPDALTSIIFPVNGSFFTTAVLK